MLESLVLERTNFNDISLRLPKFNLNQRVEYHNTTRIMNDKVEFFKSDLNDLLNSSYFNELSFS